MITQENKETLQEQFANRFKQDLEMDTFKKNVKQALAGFFVGLVVLIVVCAILYCSTL